MAMAYATLRYAAGLGLFGQTAPAWGAFARAVIHDPRVLLRAVAPLYCTQALLGRDGFIATRRLKRAVRELLR